MRALLAAAVSLLASAAFAQVAMVQPEYVNLDRPGVLEDMARNNPERYAKVQAIRAMATVTPCTSDAVERALKVQYNIEVKGLFCGAIILTSYPAKRDLTFSLEETRYSSRIELDPTFDKLTPLTPLIERRAR